MLTPCDTIVLCKILLTQDTERRILHDACIVIDKGLIIALGSQAICLQFQAKQTLNLGNALVMPGLVNAHTHVAMTFLRGLADDLPLMDWLNHHIFPVEKHLTAEIVELSALLGCAEMTRTGTTAFADMYLLEESVCAAVDTAGMKMLAGEVVFAFPSPAYATVEAALDLVRRQVARYKAHSRIRIAIMPHTVYTTTPEILCACQALAQELDISMHIHLAETPEETARCEVLFGKRPLALCQETGLCNARTTFAHVVDVTPTELNSLAASKAVIAHNPKSNMKLASGVAPVSAMLERGMLPGLGTDGAASNNALNLFSEMSACALLQKVHNNDSTLAPAQTVLDMATRGSAAALHWDGLGTLTVGGPADLIALDLDAPNLQPLYNPVSHLVYAASGHEVCFSMVNGETLYHNGHFLQIDYPTVLDEIKKLQQWVLRKRG